MTPRLTDEMRQVLAEHPDEPVYVVDASTDETYVLLSKEAYERVEPLLQRNGGASVDEFLPLAHEAFEDDWNAPGMEAYDDYDRNRQAP